MNSDYSWLLEQRVHHPDFGPGIIRRIRYGGIHSFVHFNNGLCVWVRTADLTFPQPRPPAQPEPSPTLPFDPAKERLRFFQMLEAFKLGVVPADDVPHFTFGRDRQIASLRGILQQVRDGGAAVLIEGPYGSGKTHLGTYIEYLALQQGFAVARTELDPFEVTPYKPKRIYRALMQTLRWPTPDRSIGTLRHLFEQILNGKVTPPEDHLYFRALNRIVRENSRQPEQTGFLFSWLAGELIDRTDTRIQRLSRLPLLYDHSTAADHLTYLLSGWAALLRAMGLPGLILIFDEAETAFHAHLRLERQRGMNTIRGLVDTALNRPYTLTLENLTKNPDEKAYVDAHGLVHSGLKPLPYAYRLPSHLGVILAVTPSTRRWYREVREWIPESHRLVLWPFVTADFQRMTRYVVDLYNRVFPEVALSPEDVERIFFIIKRRIWQGAEPPNPRAFLKALAELLMLRKAYPDMTWVHLTADEDTPLIYKVQ